MSFAHDTAVTPAGDDGFDAHIHEGWDIGGNANGGYLIAMAARAMTAHSGRPDPITVTAHYLSPGKVGPASVRCTTLKQGKRFGTVSATMSADDRPMLQLLGAFGDLAAAGDGPSLIIGSAPDLPPVEECVGMSDGEGFSPAFHHKVEARLHPTDAGFRRGQPSGEARVRGWFRLPDDEPMDSIALLMVLDAFPPTIFNAAISPGWVPTVELTCHVRARPAPGWLRAEFRTRFVSGGFLEEDGELWDTEGRLVAQSRQLALAPRSA